MAFSDPQSPPAGDLLGAGIPGLLPGLWAQQFWALTTSRVSGATGGRALAEGHPAHLVAKPGWGQGQRLFRHLELLPPTAPLGPRHPPISRDGSGSSFLGARLLGERRHRQGVT